MGAFKMEADFLERFFGRAGADFGARPGAETAGGLKAKLQLQFGARAGKGLRIGIGDDELDTLKVGFDHVVDGVAASPAYAKDNDFGSQFLGHRAPVLTISRPAGPYEAPPSRGGPKKRLSERG
jgi:hypothetical protein